MVRFANSLKDKNEAFKMWSQCFTDSSSYVEYYFSKRYENSNFLLCENSGKILGGLHLNPYMMSFYGEIEKTFYLVAVATSPQYRGRGVLSSLMEETFKISRERGVREIFLHPIDSEIYKRYGFAFTHFIHEYRIELNEIKSERGQERGIEIVEITADDFHLDYEAILKFYNRGNSTHTSTLIKSKEDMGRYLDELNFEGGYLYKLLEDERVVGIFSYTIEEDKICVRDILFENLRVFKTILNFLRSFKDYYRTLIIKTSPVSDLIPYFSNPEKIEKREIPFMMTKIIDKKKSLEQFFLKNISEPNKKFQILVEDLYEKKVQIFQWNRSEIEKIYEENISDSLNIPDLISCHMKTDWGTLTSLLYGGMSIDSAINMDKIQIDYDSILYKIFKNIEIKRGFILEYV